MKRDLTLAALSTPMHASGAWRRALPVLALAIVWIVAWYAPTARSIVETWARSETYAHGFVVLPIVAWLVFRARDRLRALSPRPSWPAIALLAVAGFAWLTGIFGAVNALAQTSFVALLVLAVPAILGVDVARALMFPLGFLFFAVPIGDFLLPTLMERTADFTILALRMSGVPVYREGLQFVIPTGRWSIIEACSGVRYLIASLMTGTVFAYITYRANWRRFAFIGVAIAVPILANWVRAYMIVMIGHLSNNRLATGIDHVLYGWLFFGIVMLLMFWIGSSWREPPAAKALAAVSSPPPQPKPTRLGPVAAAVLVVTATWPVIASMLATDTNLHPVALGTIDVPRWTAVRRGPDFTPRFVAPSSTVQTTLQRDAANVGLYVAYYRGQDFERKLVSSENVLVPTTGSEWISVGSTRRDVTIGGVTHRIVATTLAGPGARRLLAWQWYWIDGDIVSNDFAAKARTAWLRLTGRGDDAAGVVLHTTLREGQDANAVLQSFVQDAWPAIDASLRATQKRR